MAHSPNDQLIGLVIGTCILLYLVYLLTGKKLFGNLVANASQMVIEIFAGFLKGIYRGLRNVFFPKQSRPGKNWKNKGRQGRHKRRRRTH